MAIGFDGLLNFYANRENITNKEIEESFLSYIKWDSKLPQPYFVDSSDELLNKIGFDMRKGLTISAPGFYGPQGRILRLQIIDKDINQKITDFSFNDKKITNYEMESSAIYGLSKHLGHNAVTVCNIIANRIRKEYSSDYKIAVKKLVKTVLDRLVIS